MLIMIVQPPLAKLRTYMLREPIIKVVILTNLKSNHNLLSYRSDNHGNNQGNNQGRNQFFQGANHVQNPTLAYQALAYQALAYQAPAYQAPTLAYQAPPYQALVYQALIPQPQVVTSAEFSYYMKANDAIL
ncbi:hypothetical protein Tco_0405840 [Tanacetum coccineum]